MLSYSEHYITGLSFSVDVDVAEWRFSRIVPFHKVVIISQSLKLPLHFSQPISGL